MAHNAEKVTIWPLTKTKQTPKQKKEENKTNKPPFLSGPEPTLIRNFLLIW